MSKSIYIQQPEINSTSYINFIKGYSQTQSDGNTTIISQIANNQPIINPGDTYSALFANANWITIPSSTNLSKGFKLNLVTNEYFHLASTKTLLLSFIFKSSSKPTTNGFILGNCGPGASGWSLSCDSSVGGMQFKMFDVSGTNGFYSTRTSNICDGYEHKIVVFADSVSKKLVLSVDGIIIENQITTATSGMPTFPTTFGSAGNPTATGTWDTAASPTSSNFMIKSIHYLLLNTLPSNYKTIIKYLNTVYINKPIPISICS
jgi:hypothetical protein